MWEDVKTTCNPEEKVEGHKRRVTRKEYKKLREEFEVGLHVSLPKKKEC